MRERSIGNTAAGLLLTASAHQGL